MSAAKVPAGIAVPAAAMASPQEAIMILGVLQCKLHGEPLDLYVESNSKRRML